MAALAVIVFWGGLLITQWGLDQRHILTIPFSVTVFSV
jgi:hypothetical protein